MVAQFKGTKGEFTGYWASMVDNSIIWGEYFLYIDDHPCVGFIPGGNKTARVVLDLNLVRAEENRVDAQIFGETLPVASVYVKVDLAVHVSEDEKKLEKSARKHKVDLHYLVIIGEYDCASDWSLFEWSFMDVKSTLLLCGRSRVHLIYERK